MIKWKALFVISIRQGQTHHQANNNNNNTNNNNYNNYNNYKNNYKNKTTSPQLQPLTRHGAQAGASMVCGARARHARSAIPCPARAPPPPP